MCTLKPYLITPVKQRTCLSLPECPPAPKAQKSALPYSCAGFPSLPFLATNCEVEEEKSEVNMMLKPRPVYESSTRTRVDTLKKEEARPHVSSIHILLRTARESNEDFVLNCLQSPHKSIPKAA